VFPVWRLVFFDENAEWKDRLGLQRLRHGKLAHHPPEGLSPCFNASGSRSKRLIPEPMEINNPHAADGLVPGCYSPTLPILPVAILVSRSRIDDTKRTLMGTLHEGRCGPRNCRVLTGLSPNAERTVAFPIRQMVAVIKNL
jgi:hypothetical protein